MTPSNFEQLRKAIIEAVPEILELKFGCEILCGDVRTRYLYDEDPCCVAILPGINNQNVWPKEQIIILGRPIALADVLRATGGKVELAFDGENNEFLAIGYDDEEHGLKWDHWNLSLPLSGQSPELKEFLYKLIVKE